MVRQAHEYVSLVSRFDVCLALRLKLLLWSHDGYDVKQKAKDLIYLQRIVWVRIFILLCDCVYFTFCGSSPLDELSSIKISYGCPNGRSIRIKNCFWCAIDVHEDIITGPVTTQG
jgi:hypothetical protein